MKLRVISSVDAIIREFTRDNWPQSARRFGRMKFSAGRDREIRGSKAETRWTRAPWLDTYPESPCFPGRDMIGDTRCIEKITSAKYSAHLNVRAAGASHVMQRSCSSSTPIDPSALVPFGTTDRPVDATGRVCREIR